MLDQDISSQRLLVAHPKVGIHCLLSLTHTHIMNWKTDRPHPAATRHPKVTNPAWQSCPQDSTKDCGAAKAPANRPRLLPSSFPPALWMPSGVLLSPFGKQFAHKILAVFFSSAFCCLDGRRGWKRSDLNPAFSVILHNPRPLLAFWIFSLGCSGHLSWLQEQSSWQYRDPSPIYTLQIFMSV